jgi:hypothetical protein
MMLIYYPHSKNIQNLKVMEFESLLNKNSNFKSPLPHVNGCNVHDI